MIVGKWIDGRGEGFGLCAHIRKEVLDRETDERDAFAAHVLIFDEAELPAATGRLYPAQEGWRIEHICVRPPLRRQGFGDMAFRMLCDRALQTVPDARLTLYTPAAHRAYYEGFGFCAEGPADGEGLLPMAVRACDFRWNTACGH